ncbi:MAG: ArnT family glycosyltransferase [Xenococcus sp. (in: cyanobacteria)]
MVEIPEIPLDNITSKDDKTQNNKSWLIPAIALCCLGIITRLPFQSQIVWGDGGNFALAVEHFDMRLAQPQMPGMFIIFIGFARFFNLFLHNPTASLVMVNVVASGVAAAMMYIIGTTWFNSRVGWTAALLMLTSPLIWFNGEMALSHMIEFAWVVLIDYAAYRTGLGEKKALFILGILMGLAGGIRPSTPFFLLPVALVATFVGLRKRKFNWQDVIVAVLMGLIAIALWMTPLIISTGGWDSYWGMIWQWLPLHTQRQDADSWVKFIDNILLLLKAVLRAVGLAIIPLLWVVAIKKPNWLKSCRRNWGNNVIALSVIPGLLFFLLVHLRRKAQTMTIMPGFILLAALAIVSFSEDIWPGKRQRWALLTAVIVSLNGLFFIFGPLGVPTWREIRSFDAKFIEPIEFIQENFDPKTTAILAHPLHKRIVPVYLREYQQPHLSSLVANNREQPQILQANIDTLVLLDRKILRNPEQSKDFQKLEMPSGKMIRYLTWSEDQQLEVTTEYVKLIDK